MQTITPTGLLADVADGDTIDRILLLRDAERRTKRDGTPFLRLTLGDRSGVVSAIVWECSGDEPTVVGRPVHVVGRFADHPRYGRQVTVSELSSAPPDVDVGELLDGPDRPTGDLEHDLAMLVDSIGDPYLRGLLRRLLGPDTDTGRRFREVPAAKYNHHAYPHGLLDHSVDVARLVGSSATTLADIDRDLAVTGALLHDIGKLDAYDVVGGIAELGDAGKLEGEIPLGYYRVRRTIEEIRGFPAQRAQALLHVILAHHGRLEWGSPVEPCTREAALVHAMDHLSGQMGAHDRLRKETEAGRSWSRYDRTLGASVFLD